MSSFHDAWVSIGPRFLPFGDAASMALPLPKIMRLSLFQISVGMTSVLLVGTLNRVMIVELGISAALVAVMVALPLLFAPFRALIGFRSDRHRSALGWRRVPYIWMGALLQFGGLAIMPFALLLLSGDTTGPAWVGHAGAALAFLLVGAGMHTVQTAGLALATDIAPPETRPKVVALLSVMLLVGMAVSALVFGALLADFNAVKLVQVVQGVAVASLVLNMIALWKQEPRTSRPGPTASDPGFREAWASLRRQGPWDRRLLALGLGSAGFAMQDVLLEPYGGQVLGLSVGATTTLTGLFAAGGLGGFAFAARRLGRAGDPHRLAAHGALVGIGGLTLVILAAPFGSALLFGLGAVCIGAGGALFVAGALIACMADAPGVGSGLALGAWGAVQATASGLGIAAGGLLRDGFASLDGAFGPGLTGTAVPYGLVYAIEIFLLFAALAAIGPLVRAHAPRPDPTLGLAGHPTS